MGKSMSGWLLIIVGILLPLVSFKFFSGYDPHQSWWQNAKKMELVISSGSLKSDPARGTAHYKLFVPYRYLLIVSMIMVVWGAGKNISARD
jgi:hypothetical protein